MATGGPTDLDDLTTCTVCLETFTRPKVLPCQHSYCYACLMLLGQNKSTITCPYCQEEHKIPDPGVSGFKDNLLLNNLVGMSLPKTEVCLDCKNRPSVPDECEHCGQKICHKCLVEHTKLAMELTNSLNQLKEILTPNPTSADEKQKLQSFKTNLESERTKMNEMFKREYLNKLIELKILMERAESMEKLMKIIEDLYDTMSGDDDESKISSCISELSEEIGEGTTVDSMKDLRNNISDLKTFVRLIQTKDEEFKFRYYTSPQEGSGQLEFGQAVVNVRADFSRSENIVDLIIQFVQDSAETLTNHVTPTCPPRAENVVPLPSPPNTADAKTQTEEKFMEIDEKSIVSHGNHELEHLTDKDANVPPAISAKDENQGTSASGPMPGKPPGTSVGEYGQNELPRHVDYGGKARRRGVVVIGQGEAVRKEDRLSNPWGCAYHEARDEIFVADSGNRRIMAYSADGRKARVFYTDVAFLLDVAHPRDVAVSSDGKHVYIAADDSLIKVNMDGQRVKIIKHFSLGDFEKCWSVVCHREFTVTVDIDHKRVIVFNDRDEEVRCLGREHLTDPRSVAVSEDGKFYVTDLKSSCVKVFDWGGQCIQTFAGTDRNADIWGIAMDGEGNVCVSRRSSHRIDVYSPRRELLTSIGGPGNKPGELNHPLGLCLTRDGRLLVADTWNDRVQIF